VKNRIPVPAETRLARPPPVSCFFGFAFLLIPIVAVVPISFSAGSSLSYPLPGLSTRWYAEVFKSPRWR
jgi:ABC-type spermidine/putrescine transport system permease subunit II